MAELILERDKRLELRGQAHHLKARVLLGANGLTEAVEKEVSRALDDAGLVKIHVPATTVKSAPPFTKRLPTSSAQRAFRQSARCSFSGARR